MSGSVEYPRNELTRMIEENAMSNRTGIRGGGVASATPLPTVRSAAMTQPADELPPLSPEERAMLDLEAAKLGLVDAGLAPEGAYASMDEALDAGKSVVVERMKFSQPANPDKFPAMDRQTAREFLGRQQPRLPDFRRVEGIDLLQNRVMIDGMEFPITEDDALSFKEFVVETARYAIQQKLDEALGLFSTPEMAEESDGGIGTEERQEVQQQSEGSSEEPSC